MKTAAVFLTLAMILSGQTGAPHIQSAEAAYSAGESALQRRQFQQAVDQFRKAIEIEPTFEDAFEKLIAACLAWGKSADAAAVMTQFLQIEPHRTRYRLLLGQILLEGKETERALAQYSFVLGDNPVNADALLGLASAARQMGMEGRAEEAMQRGRKHYPLDARFKHWYGRTP